MKLEDSIRKDVKQSKKPEAKQAVANKARAVLSNQIRLSETDQQLLVWAYRLGKSDAQREQTTIQKGESKTMAKAPTQSDLGRLQEEISKVRAAYANRMQSSEFISKMDVDGLLQVIYSDRPIEDKNKASDVLLEKCRFDVEKFTELVKGYKGYQKGE